MATNLITVIDIHRKNKYLEFSLIKNDKKITEYKKFLDILNSAENKFYNFEITSIKVISYFTEQDVFSYLKNSFYNFKQKYTYSTVEHYFEKDVEFNFLREEIKKISNDISGTNMFRDKYSNRQNNYLEFCGLFKNHLVYYYEKVFLFFDSKYLDSDNIDIHFEHINKIFDRDSEYANRQCVNDYIGDELEKRITNKEILILENEQSEIILSKFSVPQIIKILDKLNIKGMMGSKGYTDFQTVQLLADIFGRSEKTIRNNFKSENHTTTAENYISELKIKKAKR